VQKNSQVQLAYVKSFHDDWSLWLLSFTQDSLDHMPSMGWMTDFFFCSIIINMTRVSQLHGGLPQVTAATKKMYRLKVQLQRLTITTTHHQNLCKDQFIHIQILHSVIQVDYSLQENGWRKSQSCISCSGLTKGHSFLYLYHWRRLHDREPEQQQESVTWQLQTGWKQGKQARLSQ